jgi:hypothetical protein
MKIFVTSLIILAAVYLFARFVMNRSIEDALYGVFLLLIIAILPDSDKNKDE